MAAPSFPYLSDDPQAYLLFLKDYIYPCTDICYNCKVRCVDNFTKSASALDLGWNRISPDERLRSVHTFLDVQLADLGVNSTNNYGLDLSKEEIDQVFQPAVRRLTLDSNWYTLFHAFAAMTCYRGMGRSGRAHDRFDQYKLGKKVMWMACPRFTAYELARPRLNSDIMAKWLWNLAQLLSDGADVYLSSTPLPETGDGHLSPSHPSSSSSNVLKPADTTSCTCPIFSVLKGKHPDTYNGYDWINLVLRTAQSRIEPSLLEAWLQPLNENELLSSSMPYRPLCPGYDCQTDRNWQEDFVHKRNNVIDASDINNGMFETSVDLMRFLTSGNDASENDGVVATFSDGRIGGGSFFAPVSDASAYPALPVPNPDSLKPGFLLPTGTPLNSALIRPQFRSIYLHPFYNPPPPERFPHDLRQKLCLKTYLTHTFCYSPGCDTGEDKIPDLFVRAIFSSMPFSDTDRQRNHWLHPPIPPRANEVDIRRCPPPTVSSPLLNTPNSARPKLKRTRQTLPHAPLTEKRRLQWSERVRFPPVVGCSRVVYQSGDD